MKKIVFAICVAAILVAGQADAANNSFDKFSSWMDDTFGIRKLLDCNSSQLRKMVQEVVEEEYLMLGGPGQGSPEIPVLKESNSKEDQIVKRGIIRRTGSDNVRVCRPANKDEALPIVVIEFINPSTQQLGGIVAGYGAGSRAVGFGSTED